MSSVIFQPLLHDPLGWKPTGTTYGEHFQWRKVRINRKDKIVSPYGQKYLRQKSQDQIKRTNSAAQRSTNEENLVPTRVVSSKKSSEERQSSPTITVPTRPPSSKSAPAVLEDSIQIKSRRSATLNRESNNASRISQRSTSHSVASEEITHFSPVYEGAFSQQDEPAVLFFAPPVEDTRHWLVHPIPRTPQYIIDSKVRLGQIKSPALLARSKSALCSSTETPPMIPQIIERTESTKSTRSQKQRSAEQRHFLDFNLPETPDELRAARHRVDKYRYNPSLDNYPTRAPSTIISVNEENTTALTTTTEPVGTVNQNEIEPVTTAASNQETSTNEDQQKENEENPSSTVVIPINTDHLPKSYVQALETANVAEEKYLRGSKENSTQPSEVIVYRLPSRTQEKRSVSSKSNRQATPGGSNTNNSLRQQDFNSWIRQATDQERFTAMKILNDALQPVNNDDQPIGQRSSTAPRSRSGLRKLGRVRTQPRISAEQNALWNIPKPNFDQEDTVTSFHYVPNSKSSIVQI